MGAFLAKAIATACGVGYAPIAPGTAGTLAAVPLAWALAPLDAWAYLGATVALLLVAVAGAGAADRAWGTHDSGRIVIDEVVGYLLTVAAVPRDRPLALAAGVILFRVLDIAKPPPVRWLDRNLPGGWGVVLDDAAAGAIGGVLLGVGWRLLGGAPAW